MVAKTLGGGGLAEDAIHTIHFLGRAITNRARSMDPSSTTRHLFQRFAIACLWLHHHPTLPGWSSLIVVSLFIECIYVPSQVNSCSVYIYNLLWYVQQQVYGQCFVQQQVYGQCFVNYEYTT